MNVQDNSSAYISIFQVLQDRPAAGFAHPPLASAKLYTAIDALRRSGAPRDHIALAEEVAVSTHCLQAALRTGDRATAAAMRARLSALFDDWMAAAVLPMQ